jgi:signal transduction histidine kinase
VVLDADGEPSVLQGYLVDVTEQRAAAERHERLETDLRHAQKMEALGRLAGGVAHDFNNLLTAIAGYSEVLTTELPPDEPLREAAEEIARAADRAGMLTRQLLTFSRRRIVQGQVLDLNEVVSATAPMLRRLVREDVVFTTILDPGPLWVEGDPGQLEQVVVNLVVNARDAMPTGGRLTIETDTLELTEREPDRHPELARGSYVVLSVSDQGEGIDETAVGRIFEPFFTTKEIGRGTGLGLSIVYAIARESGGQVDVKSQPGRGSTFSVLLPAAAGARLTAETPEREAPARRGSGNVLLVEDEDVVRDLVARTLRQHGYDVLEARDGAEALELVESCSELELILTDLVMPRMSGYELAERLRSTRPETCVVFISGYASDRVAAGRSLPNDAVVVEKPFTPSHLLQRVDEALRKAKA